MIEFLTRLLDVLKTVAAAWLSYNAGKNAGRVERSEEAEKVKHDQLQAVVNKPDASDRLSSGTF